MPTVGGRGLGRTCVCVALHWCCVMNGCGCATICPHCQTDPVYSMAYVHPPLHAHKEPCEVFSRMPDVGDCW